MSDRMAPEPLILRGRMMVCASERGRFIGTSIPAWLDADEAEAVAAKLTEFAAWVREQRGETA